jgi:hypothetical protein
VALGGSGWLWLALGGSGWLWLALAGSGWLWLALAGSGWLWVALGGSWPRHRLRWLWVALGGSGWLMAKTSLPLAFGNRIQGYIFTATQEVKSCVAGVRVHVARGGLTSTVPQLRLSLGQRPRSCASALR